MGKTGLGAIVCKTAHVRFCWRKWVLTRLCSKNRKQGHTRQNRGCFGWGWYHYPRRVPHVHEHPRAGCQNGVLCRFWVLVGCAPEERRKPAGQRCAHARRCPAGVAAPLGCVIFFTSAKIATSTLCAHRAFPRVRGGGGITTLGALCALPKRWTTACQSGLFAVFLRPLCSFWPRRWILPSTRGWVTSITNCRSNFIMYILTATRTRR